MGYYNNHDQTMHQEDMYIYQADYLAVNISKSLNDTIDNVLSDILETSPVLIFRNKTNQVFAYFPLLNIAKISNVVYNKKKITKIPVHLSSYFTPGKPIPIKNKAAVSGESNSMLEPWQESLKELKNSLPTLSDKQQKKEEARQKRMLEQEKREQERQEQEQQWKQREQQKQEERAVALKYATYEYKGFEVKYSKADKLWTADNHLGIMIFGETKSELEMQIDKKQ